MRLRVPDIACCDILLRRYQQQLLDKLRRQIQFVCAAWEDERRQGALVLLRHLVNYPGCVVLGAVLQLLVQRRVVGQPAEVEKVLDAVLAEYKVVLEVDKSLYVRV